MKKALKVVRRCSEEMRLPKEQRHTRKEAILLKMTPKRKIAKKWTQ